MFSGIVQALGKIDQIKNLNGGAAQLTIEFGKLPSRIHEGDSIAIDGVCFTAISVTKNRLVVDVSPETIKRTNFENRSIGNAVNLELPVSAQSLLSGHLVQGHVDGRGKVRGWERQGGDVRLEIELPKELMEFCIEKGSITVNGVSLTIAGIEASLIEVALIPYTLEHTNLGSLQKGNAVNIEVDMIGKYVVSAVKKSYDRSRLHRGQRPRKSSIR